MSDASFTTLGLDYEPSQEHHEIRMMREAELTEEERDAAAVARHRKRQRKGYSPLTSPVRQESEENQEVPRSTAEQARHIIRYVLIDACFHFTIHLPTSSDLYGPFGILNSQIGAGTYIDHLIDGTMTPEPEAESQALGSVYPCKSNSCVD